VVASTLQALKVIEQQPGLRHKLTSNAQRLYDGLKAMGLQVGPECSPIVAVTIPDQPRAIAVWKALLEKGVYLNLALPPATPDARPLLRSSISAAHTEAQLDRVIAAFAEVSEEFGLVNEPLQRATA
jgi:8-amino-7-oxononanoate synthase